MHGSHYNTGSAPLSSSVPQLQADGNHNQYSTILYSIASRNLNSLNNHLKLASAWEEWTLTILKRRVETLRYLAKEDRNLRNMAKPPGDKSSTLFDILAGFQDDAAERANSYISLETFIRLNLIQPLEKDMKARLERLRRRQKTIQELLSKLENSEKIYTRALADLESVQRKYTYLKQRQALDLSEEIEEIEIELKKCASALSLRSVEVDVAHTRMLDVQHKWAREWDSFSHFASTIDVERRTQLRKVSMELLRAEILVKEAALTQDQSLYTRLQDFNLQNENGANGAVSRQQERTVDVVAESLWPKTNITQQQLATLHTSPIDVSAGACFTGSKTPYKSSNTGPPCEKPSAPRTYSEDSFSTPRTDQPIIQVLTTNELDQVSLGIPSLHSTSSLNDGAVVTQPVHNVLPKTFKKPRKPSKPLPGLPCDGDTTMSASEEAETTEAEMKSRSEQKQEVQITLPLEKPPSLPSFSNLRLGSLGWEDHEGLAKVT